MFQSAILLTGVNLILRGSGTAFQVFLTRQIGAEGIGLLHLVMSAGALAMVAGMGGIRTAVMYLSAEELGKRNEQNLFWVFRGSFTYSILCSLFWSGILWLCAPIAAQKWVGNADALPAIRMYSAFLPIICMSSVLSGYFTARRRVAFLAAVEIGEQIVSICATVYLLLCYAKGNPLLSCLSVIGGNGIGALFCIVCLSIEKASENQPKQKSISVKNRILQSALPLAGGDILRTGISSAENMIVPKRLALNSQVGNSLAAFGILSGMVFPVVMFPACILFGLCEVLIPEMAACKASGYTKRIQNLMHKSLRIALIYGSLISGLLFLCAERLCIILYGHTDAMKFIKLFSLLIPMLYCDAVTDAMTKGLGQQKACVKYNILTNTLDVILLFFLLPKLGLMGYYLSFTVTHALNLFLSLRKLMQITEQSVSASIPILTVTCCWFCSLLCRSLRPAFHIPIYTILCLTLLYLLRIIRLPKEGMSRQLFLQPRN